MRIGLHDAEREYLKNKRFPNYALMKISAWHKAQGDSVEWWNPLIKYDRVYSSKVFDFTPVDPYLPENAIRGGTGYRDIQMNRTLPDEIDNMFPDYSIYPECDFAIGYLTRGCPNNCRWCVVPQKEGNIRQYRKWQELVRHDTDKLVLMDNNILSCNYGISQLKSLIGSGYRIDLNQGMDARMVTEQVADIISRLTWIRFIRLSCDQKAQIVPVKRAIDLLIERGVRPYRIFIYLLVTANLEDASERVEALKGYKAINLYAQAERNERIGIMPNDMQLEFQQRYVYSGRYRKETWIEYCRRKSLVVI
ncbi:MAG: radical SAM protein [Lachnospiraceae bacterium]|nr:radical SAM protein [Lachnospiraceae bacterium]